jgi:hypothetical protein
VERSVHLQTPGSTVPILTRAICWRIAGRFWGRAAGAWVLSCTIESLLRDVTPSDPLTYSVAGTVLWTIAVITRHSGAMRRTHRIGGIVKLLRGD